MTTHRAPGKAHREGLTLMEAVARFDTEEKAEAWFIAQRWPHGVTCPACASDNIATVASRKPQPYRCRTCRKCFSVKTGTLLHSSNLPLRKWAIAFYLYSTNLKGVSSMKLHRDLGISQKAAWYMAHRIRGTWAEATDAFAGPVEVDETFVGGKEKNKHARKRLRPGGGQGGKVAVAGVKDRSTNQVHAEVVGETDTSTLRGFIAERTAPGAAIYTDGHAAYRGLPNHAVVEHGVGEYVRGQVHTNGMESFWSMLKRGLVGTYHHVSPKHLDRYVDEFAGRHNLREANTVDQMGAMAFGAAGKRLTYRELTA
jgi:transposase-like protein